MKASTVGPLAENIDAALGEMASARQMQYAHAGRGTPFELGAMTVDPQTAAYDPSALVPYLAALGVPYFYERQRIVAKASALQAEGQLRSMCGFCARTVTARRAHAREKEG